MGLLPYYPPTGCQMIRTTFRFRSFKDAGTSVLCYSVLAMACGVTIASIPPLHPHGVNRQISVFHYTPCTFYGEDNYSQYLKQHLVNVTKTGGEKIKHAIDVAVNFLSGRFGSVAGRQWERWRRIEGEKNKKQTKQIIPHWSEFRNQIIMVVGSKKKETTKRRYPSKTFSRCRVPYGKPKAFK